jgi:hypothetical protein
VVGVQASWTVPRVNVSQKDGFSAAWIGIGGQLDDTLIQTGTEQDSISGQEQYSAWYELLPYDSVPIPTIDVSWGDNITASITLVNSDTDAWSVQISDLTTGQSFQENFFYSSSRLSAEWIVERPTINNSLSALANFGNVTFTNASATISSTVGTIGNFSFTQVTMQNRQNIQLVTVSSLSPDGSSFTVNYTDSPVMAQNQLSGLLKCHGPSAPLKLRFSPQKNAKTRS